MSWASRRRTSYLTGVIVFLAAVIGIPLGYWYFTIPTTCDDGIQNQGETAIDKGGPCLLLDERMLQPHAVLWARSFRVRDGSYNAAAYIENPNTEAGAAQVRYRFGLYDAENVLVAERYGSTYIMPGGITPVLEPRIDTGQRLVAHTYFTFTDPIQWEHMRNSAGPISINNKEPTDVTSAPRLTADAKNTSVDDIENIGFIAVIFDPAGNAFAASATALPDLPAGSISKIVFTWPDPFAITVGRIDVTPLVAPTLVQSTGR